MAQEFLSKHDLSFSSRSTPQAVTALDHDKVSMAWLPVGDKWRMLRKISKENLFSVRQLDASRLLRKKKVQELIEYLHGCCLSGKAVNIGETTCTTTLNFLSNFIFSTDTAQYDSLSSENIKELLASLNTVLGTPNLADFFPVLCPFDPQRVIKRTNIVAGRLMAIFDEHISKKIEARTMRSSDAPSSSNDLADLLLDIVETDKSSVTLKDIRHLFLDLFIAGTDTTSSTLEWAMAELIHNPEKMSKARSEMEEVIGKEDRTVEESDISRLPYLQAVIKETLGMHPPVTFLLPRKAIADVEIQGYVIPKDAQIVFNLWAMGHDSNLWSDPQAFQPERFLDVDIDYKGHDFEFIPFGAGRRLCPGLPLAERMLPLMLGSLIYKFEWKLEGGMKVQDMDMSNKFGTTLLKKVPLRAIPVKA